MKYQRNNKIHRLSILKVYNDKCHYCTTEITKENMHVDHILPQDLKNKKDELMENLKTHNLPYNFDIDDFKNIVASCKPCNERKSNSQFSEVILEMALKTAEANSNKIEEMISKLKTEAKQLEYVEKSKVLLYNFLSENPIEAQEVMYDIVGEDKFFEEYERYPKDLNDRTYICSKPIVKLSANLPTEKEQSANCLLEFKSFRISDCYITLNSTDIINRLFRAAFVGDDYCKRGFVIAPMRNKKEEYIIQLPNNRFILSKSELNDLCYVADSFRKAFIYRVKEIENRFESFHFNMDNNGYRLLKIKRDLWDDIIRHVTDNENNIKSKYYLSGPNTICLRNRSNNKYIEHAYINGIYTDISGYNMFEIKNYVWIYWNPNYIQYIKSNKNYFEENGMWNARMVFSHIVNELIPIVTNIKGENNNIFSPFMKFLNIKHNGDEKIDISKFIHTDFSDYIDIHNKRTKSIENELEKIYQLYLRNELNVDEATYIDLIRILGLLVCKKDQIIIDKISRFLSNLYGDIDLDSILEQMETSYSDASNRIRINSLINIIKECYVSTEITVDLNGRIIDLLLRLIGNYNDEILLSKYLNESK